MLSLFSVCPEGLACVSLVNPAVVSLTADQSSRLVVVSVYLSCSELFWQFKYLTHNATIKTSSASPALSYVG